MKNLKILFVLLVTVTHLYAQSSITIGRGSSISINNGADVNAGNRDGTLMSAGTFNSRSITLDPVAISATSITSISFNANWNASAGANGYKLDVSTDPNFGSFITGYQNLDVGNVNTLNVNSGLSGGLTYYYRLRAYDIDGITGYSNVITVTLAPPSPVETAATNKTEVSFSANWNSSVGATGYKLDVSTDLNFGAGSFVAGFQNKDVGNVTTYSVVGLTGGTTYYYRIRSYNSSGESANSGTITILTIPVPPNATAASSLTQTSFVAGWQVVTSATGYRLDVSTSATFAAGSFVTGYENIDVGNVLSYTVNTNLSAGTTYYYRVRAYNATGTSGNSNAISLITIPPNPVSIAATNFSTSSFDANWNASTGATKYYLDVSTDAAFAAGTFVTGYENLDAGNVITYTINTNLSAGTIYYYRVRAANVSGTSGNSTVITAMTLSTAPVATAASSITQTSFSANWNASVGAEKYYLDVATDNTFSSYVAGYQNKDVGAVTTYSINTNLSAGTTYYYRIRAFNVSGNSSNSNVISLVTVPPNPISAVGTNVTGTSFDANWNAAASATGYKLDVSTDNAFGAGAFLAGFENKDVGNVVTFSISGLSENTNYYYRVRAYNVSGTSGNSGIITVLTAPTIPVAIAATTITASSFNANWNASVGTAKYYLDVATDNGFTSYVAGYQNKDVGNITTYNINGLTAGTNYYYRVRANNAGGTSGSSNTITLATIPGAPTSTAATLVVSTSFSANWNAVTGAAGYKLDVSTVSNFASYVAGFDDLDVGNVTTYSVTGLSSNTTYYYRVEAYNNYGIGANSGVITVLTTPSSVVATSATTIQTTSFTSNWDALVGVNGYYLDVATDNGFTSYVVGYQNKDVGNVTTHNVAGLLPGINYYYRVRAYNGSGAGNNSNVISLITLPSAPVATNATTITTSSFDANWNATVGAAKYYLDVATDIGFTSYVAGYQNKDVGNVTTSAIVSLSSGTNYYYRVRAFNASGTSANSNTIGLITLPAAPVATNATTITTSSFDANWDASVGSTKYYLDVATDNGFTSYVAGYQNRDVGNVSTFNINGLTAGTNYYYRVRAFNASGTSSNSNVINLITMPIAPVATNATTITTSSFDANWNVSVGASKYYLDVATDNGFTSYVAGYQNKDVGNVTIFGVDGLTAGANYYYRVRAFNSSGTSTNSNVINLITVSLAPVANAATTITPSSFDANWNASVGAAKYYLDVATDNGFTSYVVGYQNKDVGNVTTYNINGLTSGTNYYYRVRANNAGGTSGSSNTIALATVPANPTATAATLVVSTSFSSNWNAVTGATGYKLDVSTVSNFTSFLAGYNDLDVGNVTTYSVTGLNSNTTYYYRLRAFNNYGESGNSGVITVLTTPSAVVATSATTIQTTSFTSNWNALIGVSGYYLDVATDNGFTSYVVGYQNKDVGNVTTHNVVGLLPGINYYYRVRAYNGTGAGNNSNVISLITLPSAPVATNATTITTSSFDANWNASVGAAKYYLDVATDNGFTSYVAGYQNKDVGNVTTSAIVSLSSGTNYYYRVRAFNASGTSANSNTIGLITLPAAPVATNATTITTSSFDANWNASVGAVKYYLDMATDNGFTSYVAGYQNKDVGNVTTLAIASLSSGTNYYYRVRAFNASGTSSNSNVINLITMPIAPVATNATTITTSSFDANWNASVGSAKYYLDVATDNGFTSFLAGYQNKDVGNVTTLAIASLTSGTNYYYRVRAFNASGTSVNSNIIGLITLPAAPVATNATTITISSFDANWNRSVGAVKYYLDVATDNGFTSYVAGYQNRDVGNVSTFNINGLTAGTNYYYRVRAFNIGGTSSNSNTISLITVSQAPIANSAINITQTGFEANWNPTTGAAGYLLDVVTDNGFTSYVAGYQNKDVWNVTSLNITGLTPGATYYYQVRAYNNSGTSNNSNIVGLITMSTVPVAANATNITQTSFAANWSASIGAEKYFLDLATDSLFTSFVSGFNNRDVGNITTLSISNLTENTSYYYRIRAFNASGSTSNSNRISVKTLPSYLIISGNAGISNAVLSYHDVTDKMVSADGAGNFSISVSYGWSGTITPSTPGVIFSPSCRTCSNITCNLTDQNFTASINTYLLTITSVNGAVYKNPDLASYTHGTQVQITATPTAGYTFTGWSGDASGSANPITVTMTGNKNIIANYSINTYSLTITSENGSVIKNPDQENYNHGSTVQLTASPITGYTFVGWSGDVSGSANPITIIMDGNKSIAANYSVSTYALTVISVNGTITKNPDQVSYAHGAQVQITAVPITGYTFIGWSGDATGSENPLTVIMDGSKNITANYSINTFTLSITSINGTVAKSPDQASYNYGSQVQLTATPTVGYSFTNWSGDASGAVNPVTINMDGDKNITANYSINTYTIAITSVNGTVTKEPDLTNYNHGTQVKLTAIPSDGYKFSQWIENGNTLTTNSVLQFEIISNRVLTAVYEKVNHPPVFVRFLPDTTINVHSTQVAFNYQYLSVDPDGDVVTYNLDSGPDGATLSSSGLFSWIPKTSQAGQQFLVVVTITDGKFSETKISSLTTNPVIVSVEKISDAIPIDYKLYQNYPNPFNPTTKIQFDLPKEGMVRLTVYNSLGQEVEILVNQVLSAGKYSKNFDASELSNGIYFFRLQAKDFVLSKKMILVK
ncbi:MAG: fibronectin type III domain-containing protein [Ignavibacteriales bacterium]|nr:fibronectin type III domain-containing protein [Ignavibacteriales bacterium]